MDLAFHLLLIGLANSVHLIPSPSYWHSQAGIIPQSLQNIITVKWEEQPTEESVERKVIASDNKRVASGEVHLGGSLFMHFPYSTVVGVGSCTGTLISPTHVLTAAHCIRRRTSENNSSPNANLLTTYFTTGTTISYPDITGTRHHLSQKVTLSSKWMSSLNSSDYMRTAYDWALVTLRWPVACRTKFPTVSTIENTNLLPKLGLNSLRHIRVSYMSYANSRHQLSHHSCILLGSTYAVIKGNVVVAYCPNIQPGNSGSAVFLSPVGGAEDTILGVVSGMVTVTTRRDDRAVKTVYTLISAFTSTKIRQLCQALDEDDLMPSCHST